MGLDVDEEGGDDLVEVVAIVPDVATFGAHFVHHSLQCSQTGQPRASDNTHTNL